MFEKNIKSLKEKNPSLAKKLKEIDIESLVEIIGVYEANSKDLIISYKDEMIHDMADPVREAMFTWNKQIKGELKPKDIQIVYGLGLGYLFKRAYINSNSRIYLYEPFIDILRFVLEYVDFSAEFSDERVTIFSSIDEIIEKLSNEYLQGDRVEFLFLNSYAKLATNELMTLTGKTVDICQSRGIDQNTIFSLCKLWTLNSIKNINHYKECTPASYLSNKFSQKTAIILASGPSLRENFEKIKENRDKFVIIAVGQAIKFLQAQDFVPDFMAFADAENMYTLVDGYDDFKTDQQYLSQNNILLTSRADNYLFTKKFNSKILYFTKSDDIAKWINNKSKDELGLYESGGTVSIMCYAFAKALGCKKIVFSGLDLAFIDNKIYAHGKELEVDEKGNIKLGYEIPVSKKLIYVKDINGKNIPTRDDYASFIRHFEEIFTQKDTDEVIINTSLKGAYVKGMEYKSFEEVINEETNTTKEVNKIIKCIKEDNNQRWSNSLSNLKTAMIIQQEEIEEIHKVALTVNNELNQICLLFEQPELQNNLLQAKIENIKEEMTTVREKVLENVFLSNYLQGEMWEYTQKYKMAILPKLEDIKHNMYLEKNLFESIITASKEIIALLNTDYN